MTNKPNSYVCICMKYILTKWQYTFCMHMQVDEFRLKYNLFLYVQKVQWTKVIPEKETAKFLQQAGKFNVSMYVFICLTAKKDGAQLLHYVH